MPQHVFRLQPLLRARVRDEMFAAGIDARAQQAVAVAQRRHDEALQRLDAAQRGIAGSHGASLRMLQAHLDVLRRRAADLCRAHIGAQRAAAVAHAQLLGAVRARAVLERLRDRDLEAAARSRRTAEECERDDVSLHRMARV